MMRAGDIVRLNPTQTISVCGRNYQDHIALHSGYDDERCYYRYARTLRVGYDELFSIEDFVSKTRVRATLLSDRKYGLFIDMICLMPISNIELLAIMS